MAISVLILRYQPTVTVDTGMADEDDTDDLPEVSSVTDKPLFNVERLKSIRLGKTVFKLYEKI